MAIANALMSIYNGCMASQTIEMTIAPDSWSTDGAVRAARRADSLRRVIELISGELALESLLTRIIESAIELTGAQYWAG
jgi:hypothetical protein